MNRFRQIVPAIAFVAGIAGTPIASAGPISHVVDPTDITIASDATPASCSSGFTCGNGFISYFHDITVPVGDTVVGATLRIFLRDPGQANGGNEEVHITIGSGPVKVVHNVNDPTTETILLDASLVGDLGLGVKIEVFRQGGGAPDDVTFDRSELTVFTENTGAQNVNASALPEPTPLALLGLGLAGLAWSRRKK